MYPDGRCDCQEMRYELDGSPSDSVANPTCQVSFQVITTLTVPFADVACGMVWSGGGLGIGGNPDEDWWWHSGSISICARDSMSCSDTRVTRAW